MCLEIEIIRLRENNCTTDIVGVTEDKTLGGRERDLDEDQSFKYKI